MSSAMYRASAWTALACTQLLTTAASAAEFRDVTVAQDTLKEAAIATNLQDTEALGRQLIDLVGLDPNTSLQVVSEKPLPMNLGRSVRYEQQLNDVPILWSEVIVNQSNDATIRDVGGRAVYDIEQMEELAAAEPAISPEEALDIAKGATGKQEALAPEASQYENEEVRLIYYLGENGELTLSYYTSFLSHVVDGGSEEIAPGAEAIANCAGGGEVRPSRPVYIINAATREIIDSYDNIQCAEVGTGPGGNDRTSQYYYGQNELPKFEAIEDGTACRMDSPNVKTENLNHDWDGPGTPFTFNCYENTVKEINGAYSPLNDAQVFGTLVFNMFNDWYGASPLDRQLHLRVHYGTGYENATWDGQRMTFGDGGTTFYPLVSMDVAAHEVAHGFTEQNSGLIYRDQSGAMNEAFSDMAGEAAEFYWVSQHGPLFTRAMPDLETGADIFKAAGEALRYMCDPSRDGVSIDHVDDYYDGLDVHYSSGVYNKAFCLLAQRPNWDVKRAFDVFVVANQAYWGPTENFESGAEKVLKATRLLQYPEADVIYAFSEVGIDLGSAPAKDQYLYSTLRVIGSGANRGCGYGDWGCMTNLCTQDLGTSAWRGWAGCYQEGDTFQCYFECGMVRRLE